MGIDIILKIAGIGLLTAVVCIVLKKTDRDEIATFATLAGIILVVVLLIDMLSGLFDNLKSLLALY
ncbi:MAG: stage III sporulation protein AC [Clostridia bacterium]|nr:stage III sporulation protein AC [Clostridia bacterium]